MLQVAKKHAEEMPLGSTLPGVAAAAKVSISATQAELQDLGASCAQLRRLLDSLSASGADAFVEVRRWAAWDSSLSAHYPKLLQEPILAMALSRCRCDCVCGWSWASLTSTVPIVHHDIARMII